MKINDIKKYIELYNIENYLFHRVGERIRKNKFLNFDDFFLICMWKSARQKKRYIKNIDVVGKITEQAFLLKDEKEKILKICELSGVGIPTASAILTIAYPSEYAIIDIRCIQMLKKLGYTVGKTMSVNNWINYTNIMRQLAKENGVTPREMDMTLFSMHREWLHGDEYRNLY